VQIFLNASLTEAFCIAIVEAASCGMVVVSTAVGGVPEVLPDDVIILSPPTVEGLVAAVTAALPRAAALTPARRLSQHERVARMYDWRVVAERTERAYTTCLQQAPLPDVYERLLRALTIGPVAGVILACAVALLEMCAAIAAWIAPIAPRQSERWVKASPQPRQP